MAEPGPAREAMLRSCCVGGATAADIAVNYPLWIVARRIGAGIASLSPRLLAVLKSDSMLL